MMKRLQWFTLLAVLALVASGLPIATLAQGGQLAPSEVTGEIVYVPFPVKIALDGDMSDWAGVPVEKVDRGTTISPDPAEDGSFSFALAADASNLYIWMTSVDKNIITGKHSTDFWNEDSLEFFVNFTGDTSPNSYVSGIAQVNINPSDIGKKDLGALTLTGTNSKNIKVQGIVFKTADGWGFEASTPLPWKPEHGKQFGFQAQANGASKQDRDVKLIWSLADKNDSSYANPSLFGRALLFEVGRTDVPKPTEAAKPLPRALIAVNQVGYLPNEPKWGVLATEQKRIGNPNWTLKNAATGDSVAKGQTTGGTLDESSGDYIYTADFSDVKTPGSYVLSVAGRDSAPFKIGNDVYSTLKQDALRYFYLNRSGIPLEEKYAGKTWARAAGHVSDNDVTCFKGKDASGKDWEGCAYRLDASGGWYDAGDFGKYVVNGGIATWTLLNWYEHSPKSLPDSSLNIPESGNGVPDILDEARWEMDFMLKMQVPEGQPLAGMVHHKLHNLQWPSMPAVLPEKIDNDDPANGRYLMPPSTAATLNLASTAAQCARIWKSIDAAFADRCLKAAQTAWKAALANPKMLYGSIPGNGGGDYGDGNVDDEFYWAAAELYITTGEAVYHDYLTGSPFFTDFPGLQPKSASSMNWGSTAALGTISLVTVSNDLPKEDVDRMRQQIVQTADGYLKVIKGEGYGVPLTGTSLTWGSNSDVLNNALVMALAYDFTQSTAYLDGVTESMNYLLGRNANNQSFVSGYGTTSLLHPHHRVWGNQPDAGFPPPPPGAIAGGANAQPSDPIAIEKVNALPPARRYLDNIGSYSTNEVCINWNAPLVWVTGYLDEQASK